MLTDHDLIRAAYDVQHLEAEVEALFEAMFAVWGEWTWLNQPEYGPAHDAYRAAHADHETAKHRFADAKDRLLFVALGLNK